MDNQIETHKFSLRASVMTGQYYKDLPFSITFNKVNSIPFFEGYEIG